MSAGQAPPASSKRLALSLLCFGDAKAAGETRKPLNERLEQAGDRALDEVVLRVSKRGHVRVYDPHRVFAGTLTALGTWGAFGLVASSGRLSSFVLWGVIGAISGGGYAYLSEHLLTRQELKKLGNLLGPETSTLFSSVETRDPEAVGAAAAESSPVTSSVVSIDPELSADFVKGGDVAEPGTELSMLLLRFKGRETAKAEVDKLKGLKAPAKNVQPELIFEVNEQGKTRVSSPSAGVAAMAKTDVISWGGFGLVVGALVGFLHHGGLVGDAESAAATGIGWAVFGLAAGALYGLFAGRGVSARRVRSMSPLLVPDTSTMLAWSDNDISVEDFAGIVTPAPQGVVVRFNSSGDGAALGLEPSGSSR